MKNRAFLVGLLLIVHAHFLVAVNCEENIRAIIQKASSETLADPEVQLSMHKTLEACYKSNQFEKYHDAYKTHLSVIQKYNQLVADIRSQKSSALDIIFPLAAMIPFALDSNKTAIFYTITWLVMGLHKRDNDLLKTSEHIKSASKDIEKLLADKNLLQEIPEDVKHIRPQDSHVSNFYWKGQKPDLDATLPACSIRHGLTLLADQHPEYKKELHDLWSKVTDECNKRYDNSKR